MEVARFMHICSIHLDASRGWSGSFRFVGFTRACSGGRRVDPYLFGLFLRVLDPWCGRSHLGSMVYSGSFRDALGAFVFTRVRWIYSCAPWLSSGSFIWVHCGAPCGVVGFIWVHWVHLCVLWWELRLFVCDLVLIRRAMEVVGFILARPGGRSVRSDLLWMSLVSFRLVEFILARPWSRLVHLGSFGRVLGVVGFIRVRTCDRRVNSGPPLMSSGSFGSLD